MPRNLVPNSPVDPNTEEFLRLCLSSRWHPVALAAADAMRQQMAIDWKGLTAYTADAGLAPLLYANVRGQGLVPHEVEQGLEVAYQTSAIRNTVLSIELQRVLDMLSAAGLPPIVLKGAALGETLYGNSALRPMVDLDVLLRQADARAAISLLETAGYRQVFVEPHPGLVLEYENEVVLWIPGPMDLALELHWQLLNSPFYQRQLDEAWFWQTAQHTTLAGTQALVLGLEANVLYLSAHHVLHHHGQGLRWLVDIAMLVAVCQAEIDWSILLDKAQAFRLVSVLQVVVNQLVTQWLVPVPTHVLEQIERLPVSPEERQVVNWMLAQQRPVALRFWADLSSMPGWRQRVPYALAHLFPDPAYMKDRYNLAHPLLLPFAYPYRWTLGLLELMASRKHRPPEEGR